jgi:proteic killer suppression protein
VEIEFDDDELDRLETDARYIGKHSATIVSLYRKRLQTIRSAPDERDLYALKSLHFEKLKGQRSHQHSIRLNDQWRLILEFKGKSPNKKIIIMAIEDYH